MMIPITRKEQYINEIVGKGKTAPGTPQTREEFFYAAILGEVVAPFPITNIEKYLAKIAGKYNGELPEPITRIEFFIARAAGMNVSAPTPITREEIFWSNYSAIVDFEVEGVPPLSYTAKKAGFLTDYRIYGQTSRNLLQNTATSQTIHGVTFTVNSDGSVTCNGTANNTALFVIHNFPRFSGECILSGCPMNGSQNTYRLQYTNTRDMSYKDYGTGCNIYQFDETQYPLSAISIRIENGYTCNNLTFYPMIRLATIEDDTYEPYGESVGDRTGNLFDKNGVWVNGYINDNGELAENNSIATYTEFINVKPDTDYSILCDSSVPDGVRFNFYDSSKNFISRIFRNMRNPTVTTPSTCEYITLSINKNQIQYLMIIEGSTAPTEYEPYGYKVPVTVSNGTDTLTTPIYLPEQIKKVGDEAEYIDYSEQKQHRVGAEDIDVTLPALPTLTGTNVLSVGTEVQPSNVYIKYEGAR